jgi:ATP-dependent RNA helicase DHX36
MSVAERVAAELGESTVGKLIGYQIRMEAKRSSETRLLFCTTGVILRRMIEDPELRGISHVLVDEVHERQVGCAFIHGDCIQFSFSRTFCIVV